MEWWVFPALVLCAVTFLAAAGVLVFLAARGVWRLLARYEPTHALAPNGERWVPWDTDPRFGSMQLADDVGWSGTASPAQGGPSPAPATLPPLDWREVVHEEDWRDQTAHDLAPAVLDSVGECGPLSQCARSGHVDALDHGPGVLDSGPGGTSLAPGPDWAPERLCGPEQPHEKPAGTESAGSGHLGELPGLHEWHDHAPLKWGDEGIAGCPSCEQHWECPEPELERTWAGRLVETSDEWLQRLMAAAGDGWTYAGELVAA